MIQSGSSLGNKSFTLNQTIIRPAKAHSIKRVAICCFLMCFLKEPPKGPFYHDNQLYNQELTLDYFFRQEY